MKKNIGTVDRAIRILISTVIAALFFTKIISGTLAIVLLAIAAIFLITAFVSFCPLYFLFGISSGAKKDQ